MKTGSNDLVGCLFLFDEQLLRWHEPVTFPYLIIG
jgi:hypothetical protein